MILAKDSFDRVSLGTDWTVLSGSPAIVYVEFFGATAAGDSLAAFTHATWPHDQYARAVILAATEQDLVRIFLHRRKIGRDEYYLSYTTDCTTFHRINKVDGPSSGVLWESALNVPPSGACIRFEVEGQTLRVERIGGDAGLLAEITYVGSTSGSPGLGVYNATGAPGSGLDDFQAGSIQEDTATEDTVEISLEIARARAATGVLRRAAVASLAAPYAHATGALRRTAARELAITRAIAAEVEL